MTKSELIEKLAIDKNISNAISENVVAEIFQCMTDTLISGDRTEIRGFGSFEVREYDGRTARNPKSGAKIKVAATKRPFFKVGKDIKDRIMESGK